MEVRRMLWGESALPPAARPAQKGERKTAPRLSADRLELSRQWVESMEEQRARTQAAMLAGGKNAEGDSGGLLGYMETEEDKLDAMSEQLDTQMKCLKIAMNIMKGKKVPPEDERYLMEHDPDGYKLAIAMKSMTKEDKKECESVLDDEDKEGGESGETGEAAPAESSSGTEE